MQKLKRKIAKIALEDGRIFSGFSFGAMGTAYGEIVFNTSMAGYQEILTDPLLPAKGNIFISVKNNDKRNIVFIAKKLYDMGFEIIATIGTAKVLSLNNIKVKKVGKIGEGHTEFLELMKKGKIQLVITTPSGRKG